jgi:uncharacterized SAM-binding protein YcdF (DUF218 family)
MPATETTVSWPQGASWTDVVELAQPIWDFMRLGHSLKSADIILACGSNDLATARRAADLHLRKFAKFIVISGGIAHSNDLLATPWKATEAEAFSEAIVAMGVAPAALLLEERATNTEENFRFSRLLIEASGIQVRSAIVVHKPYMERRCFATGQIAWPEISLAVTSLPCEMGAYLLMTEPATTISVMLGDFQRLKIYGDRGWLTPCVISDDLWRNFEALIRLGFDRHLIATPQP